jgi:hypothetical protein
VCALKVDLVHGGYGAEDMAERADARRAFLRERMKARWRDGDQMQDGGMER